MEYEWPAYLEELEGTGRNLYLFAIEINSNYGNIFSIAYSISQRTYL